MFCKNHQQKSDLRFIWNLFSAKHQVLAVVELILILFWQTLIMFCGSLSESEILYWSLRGNITLAPSRIETSNYRELRVCLFLLTVAKPDRCLVSQQPLNHNVLHVVYIAVEPGRSGPGLLLLQRQRLWRLLVKKPGAIESLFTRTIILLLSCILKRELHS